MSTSVCPAKQKNLEFISELTMLTKQVKPASKITETQTFLDFSFFFSKMPESFARELPKTYFLHFIHLFNFFSSVLLHLS